MARALLAVLALVVAAAAAPGAASAAPGSPTPAAVTLGDSFVSGEAGRWQGNSNDELASRDGTDRAWVRTWWGGFHDADRVYLGGSDDSGCHRSDVAPVRSAALPGHEAVNLACSGATTADVLRALSGGEARDGEPPQADRLARVARERDVRLVVLSVGGNDLGFASVIAACATAWTRSTSADRRYCAREQQALVDERMARAMTDVGRAIDDVRAVMGEAGYAPAQYRLVLQGYPSPVPRGAENRYPEVGPARLRTGRCPFWDRDLDWARGVLVDQIADGLATVAAAKATAFLDLRDLLQGREACARASALVTEDAPPSDVRGEWTRFLTSGLLQGERQESLHPNAFAQRALGRCLTLLAAQPGTAFACRTTPGRGVDGTVLAPVTRAAAARTAFARLEREARGRPRHRAPWPPRYPSVAAGRAGPRR